MSLTLEQAREASSLVRESFQENRDRIVAAKQESAGDFPAFFAKVVPLIVSVQGKNLERFGFPPTQAGIMQFMAALAPHMSDSEVGSVVAEIRQCIMPQM
ncbi:hypothetical protein RCL1_000213 [Eukaryota sp. TZLM3-RCL]